MIVSSTLIVVLDISVCVASGGGSAALPPEGICPVAATPPEGISPARVETERMHVRAKANRNFIPISFLRDATSLASLTIQQPYELLARD